MGDEKRCEYILADGSRCQAWSLKGKTLCFSHDPESREAKLIAVAKGGSAKEIEVTVPLQKIELNTPKDVILLLSATIKEVRDGSLDVRVASTLGYLAGQLIRAFEVAELNEKADKIKDIVGQMAKSRIGRDVYGR